MAEFLDFKLHSPFTMEVVGGTGSGKTHLVAQIIKNRRTIINKYMDKVIYVYCDHQPIFEELELEDPENITFTNNIKDIDNLTTPNSLCKIDDQMDLIKKGGNLELVERFFLKHAHHKDVSIILILQNAFRPGLRDININTQYLIYFDAPRDRSSFMNVAKQILPGQTQALVSAYNKACKCSEYAYLFLTLHPKDKRVKYWMRNDVFPSDTCEVYASV